MFSGGRYKNVKKIEASTLSGDPAAVNFTYSIWIYVNSWQYRYGNAKTIYRRVNSTTSNVSPEVALAASTNDLSITITTGANPGKQESWKIHNIPIQKWCNIIVCTNTRAVDTYIDGKLVNTHVLEGVPALTKTHLFSLLLMAVLPEKHLSLDTMLEPLVHVKHMIFTVKDREVLASDLLNQYKLKFHSLKTMKKSIVSKSKISY